ncbi:MAG TPA: hypothetical protein PL157_21710, partial [Acidobacteriota bacterium]|nr:hypothetical protein [Acidobacteriota bacterium]
HSSFSILHSQFFILHSSFSILHSSFVFGGCGTGYALSTVRYPQKVTVGKKTVFIAFQQLPFPTVSSGWFFGTQVIPPVSLIDFPIFGFSEKQP